MIFKPHTHLRVMNKNLTDQWDFSTTFDQYMDYAASGANPKKSG